MLSLLLLVLVLVLVLVLMLVLELVLLLLLLLLLLLAAAAAWLSLDCERLSTGPHACCSREARRLQPRFAVSTRYPLGSSNGLLLSHEPHFLKKKLTTVLVESERWVLSSLRQGEVSSIHGVAMTLTSPSPASLARLPDGASELGTSATSPSKRPSGIDRARPIYLHETTALSLPVKLLAHSRGAETAALGAEGGGGPVRSARGHDARASGRRRSAPSRRGAAAITGACAGSHAAQEARAAAAAPARRRGRGGGGGSARSARARRCGIGSVKQVVLAGV